MTDTIRRGHRGAAAAVLLVGGIAVAVATWANGQYGWAITALAIYAALAAGAFVWAGRRTDIGPSSRSAGPVTLACTACSASSQPRPTR